MAYKIKAKIVSMLDGLREYDDVHMVRIKSKTHTLLIMEDFMPVIGEVDGDVEVIVGEKSVSIEGIKGFYMHKKNEFNLLIRDGSAARLEESNAEIQDSEKKETEEVAESE